MLMKFEGVLFSQICFQNDFLQIPPPRGAAGDEILVCNRMELNLGRSVGGSVVFFSFCLLKFVRAHFENRK